MTGRQRPRLHRPAVPTPQPVLLVLCNDQPRRRDLMDLIPPRPPVLAGQSPSALATSARPQSNHAVHVRGRQHRPPMPVMPGLSAAPPLRRPATRPLHLRPIARRRLRGVPRVQAESLFQRSDLGCLCRHLTAQQHNLGLKGSDLRQGLRWPALYRSASLRLPLALGNQMNGYPPTRRPRPEPFRLFALLGLVRSAIEQSFGLRSSLCFAWPPAHFGNY